MMAGKLVTLNLGNGDLYRGFETVTVRLSQLNQTLPRQWTGVLPSRAELAELYKRWRLLYSALLHRLNVSTRLEIAAEGVENVSQSEFDQLCDQLRGEINHWLNSGSFRGVVEELRTELSTTDEIRLLVETNDQILQRLPWHLWKFFESYPKAEVGISAPDYRQFALPAAKSSTGKIRILAILGNSQGLDLNKDWEALSQLSKQGQAEIKILFQPPLNQLNDQLWNKGWDILFFAGHSFTQGKGILRINQNDSLSLDKLKHALDKSIERGLKLAIFNSCDGIGLAQALFDLHIPQVIVMREEVPDAVAHQFLPNFLVSFFDRRSLFMAVREARERLESLQNTYHCASWLPVIYQNPAAEPLVFPTVSAKPRLWPVVLTSIVVALFCIGVRQVGLLQPLDLWAYDQLMRLRPSEGQDNRLLVRKECQGKDLYQMMRWLNFSKS
jgi:hypothetical protein